MTTTANFLDRITVDPEIRFGKPTIRGTRFAVVDLFDYLSSGMSEAEILGDFPDLEHEDFIACFQWAARLGRHDHLKAG